MSDSEGNNMQHDDESDYSSEDSSDNEEVVLTGRKAILASNGSKLHTSVAAPANRVKSASEPKEKVFKNKQRTLLLSSRGPTSRHRHLLSSLALLLPHTLKTQKFDTKGDVSQLNEVAELHSCRNVMYLESRKHMDLYMWISKVDSGEFDEDDEDESESGNANGDDPSVTIKFQVQNIHTTEELNLQGNMLKGSRPLLSFDKSFETMGAEWLLMKELLVQVFGTPKGHRGSKPFYDHIFCFTIVDGRIWFKNYEIKKIDNTGAAAVVDSNGKTKKSKQSQDDIKLVEIGPRFTLNPIKIFGGAFGGPVIYDNPAYLSPNVLRAGLRRQKGTGSGSKYENRVEQVKKREIKKVELKRPVTEMDLVDSVFK